MWEGHTLLTMDHSLPGLLALSVRIISFSYFKVIRDKIPLPNDNKHMLSFKKCYDRLYKDFKDKLVAEYALMKQAYLQEYEGNFQANKLDKEAHIKEIENHISQKEEDISDKKERYDVMKHKIYQLLRMKYNNFMKKVFFNEILYFAQL